MKKEYVLLLSLFYSFYAHSITEPKCLPTPNISFASLIQDETNALQEGFMASTQIKTPEGYRNIEDIKAGDLIIGFDPIEGYKEKSVLGVTKNQIEKFIKISAGREIIYSGFNQKFYLPEKNDWIAAQDITSAEAVYSPIDIYRIEVEDHNFCITQSDIVVHNSYVIAQSASSLLNIGRMALKNPIKIVGITSNLDKAYLGLDKLEFEKSENKTNSPEQINNLTERTNYEKTRSELCKLRSDFLKLKDELDQLIKSKRPREINFTNALLNPIKPKDTSNFNLRLTPAQEAKYSDEQRANLKKLRQAELDQIEKQILDLQIALGFHFNELIDSRNKALEEHDKLNSEIDQSVNLWNSNLNNITVNIAVSRYESIFTNEDSLKNIENKNQELKFSIEYYKNIKNGTLLKKTTNISDLFDQEEKNILATEQSIYKSRNINIGNQRIVEDFLLRSNIHIVGLATNLNNKIKKQRESKLAKEFAEAEQRKGSFKFPQDPDKDDDKNKEIRICEKSAKHIFRSEEGHLLDTPANRKSLLDLVNDKKNFLGADKYGNEWYGKVLPNNQQVWASVRDGLIRNGGLNKAPKIFNLETGLSRSLATINR